MSGQSVPVIIPDLRGLSNWSTEALIDHILKEAPGGSGRGARPKEKAGSTESASAKKRRSQIRNFLDRVYNELYNLGATAQDRALNYAATNAYQAAEVISGALSEDMELDSVAVERSPVCRPESDCWDIKLTFFNPQKKDTVARKVYRFTVDVSDVIPVTIGETRTWSVF